MSPVTPACMIASGQEGLDAGWKTLTALQSRGRL